MQRESCVRAYMCVNAVAAAEGGRNRRRRREERKKKKRTTKKKTKQQKIKNSRGHIGVDGGGSI